ncbi:hypothetical protein AMTRI_Chr05g69800 [Amborella trichopoda]
MGECYANATRAGFLSLHIYRFLQSGLLLSLSSIEVGQALSLDLSFFGPSLSISLFLSVSLPTGPQFPLIFSFFRRGSVPCDLLSWRFQSLSTPLVLFKKTPSPIYFLSPNLHQSNSQIICTASAKGSSRYTELGSMTFGIINIHGTILDSLDEVNRTSELTGR